MKYSENSKEAMQALIDYSPEFAGYVADALKGKSKLCMDVYHGTEFKMIAQFFYLLDFSIDGNKIELFEDDSRKDGFKFSWVMDSYEIRQGVTAPNKFEFYDKDNDDNSFVIIFDESLPKK